jgi:hypothetical protein
MHPRERSRGIDVPEGDDAVLPQFKDAPLESFIVYADAAVLDDHIGSSGSGKHLIDAAAGCVDDRFDVREIVGITVLLAAIGIGFGKGNLVAQAREVFVTAAVIGRCAVPVGRDDT